MTRKGKDIFIYVHDNKSLQIWMNILVEKEVRQAWRQFLYPEIFTRSKKHPLRSFCTGCHILSIGFSQITFYFVLLIEFLWPPPVELSPKEDNVLPSLTAVPELWHPFVEVEDKSDVGRDVILLRTLRWYERMLQQTGIERPLLVVLLQAEKSN